MGLRARTALLIACLLAVTPLLMGVSACDDFMDNWKPLSPEEQLKENERKAIASGAERQRRWAESGEFRSEAQQVEVFNNANPSAITANSNKELTFELKAQTNISYIQTYHWKSGKPAGEISLKAADGTVYGPWKATGTEGQGGMPNAYWEVKPNVSLKPGTYTVVDSDPGSWSTNPEMGMRGQTIIRGYLEE